MGATYPLSKDQERTWFLHGLHPANPVFTVAELLSVAGPLGREPLRSAVAALAARHEALRTVVTTVAGSPCARVLSAVDPPVVFEDAQDAGDDVDDLRAWAAGAAREPFDVTRGPLWRVRVRSTGPDDHALLICADQLVADRRSLAILLRELGQLYTAEIGETPAVLDPVAGFGRLAGAERAWLSDPATLARLDVQVAELAGAPAGVELPADRLRPPVLSFAGDRVELPLADQSVCDLEAFAVRHSVEPASVLLAGLAVLVHRYAGVSEVVIGLPGRGSSCVVGPVTGVLPLRVDLADDPPFAEAVAGVDVQVREARARRDIPFGALVERLQPERDLSRRPVCQIAFELRSAPECDLRGARATWVPFGLGTSAYDLSLSVICGRTPPLAVLEYDTDLFHRESMERLAGNHLTLLAGALSDPQARVSRLTLLDTGEVRRVLAASTGDEVEMPHSAMVHEQIAAQAARRSEALALVAGASRMTYGELCRRSHQVANHLRRLGVGLQVPVGVCMRRSIDMVFAVLGVLDAGGAPVLLDPAQPARRLAFMLDDSRAPVLLTSAALLGGLPSGYGGHIRCLDRDGELIAREDDRRPAVGCHPATT